MQLPLSYHWSAVAYYVYFFSMRSAGFLTMTVDDTNSYLVTGDADGVIKVWDIAEYCVGNMVNNDDTPPRKFAVNYAGEKRLFLHFESVAKCKTCHEFYFIISFRIIYNSSPNGIVNSGGYGPRDAKRREMYLALFCTDSKRDSSFSSYQITELNKNEIVRLSYRNSLAAQQESPLRLPRTKPEKAYAANLKSVIVFAL